MSKKSFVSLIVVVLVIVQIISSYLSYSPTLCSGNEIESEIEYSIYLGIVHRVHDIISVEVVEKTQEYITFIFNNNTDNEYIFGRWFQLERRAENEWEKVDIIIDNFMFTSNGILLPPNGTLEHGFNLEWLYGTLECGEYRITTRFSLYYITINFTL